MHFLLDAHIPRRLCDTFRSAGHECTHVESLDHGNGSSDTIVAERADELSAVVVSKDDDFRISHRLRGQPARLLLIAIGNCSNDELAELVESVLDLIVQGLQSPAMVEVRRDALIITAREG